MSLELPYLEVGGGVLQVTNIKTLVYTVIKTIIFISQLCNISHTLV